MRVKKASPPGGRFMVTAIKEERNGRSLSLTIYIVRDQKL